MIFIFSNRSFDRLFAGWDLPSGSSAIVETYPALWKKGFPSKGRTTDEQNAYAVSAWLRQTDLDSNQSKFLKQHVAGRTNPGRSRWVDAWCDVRQRVIFLQEIQKVC